MKNRMELRKLDELRQTLDRQQRDATTTIDRHKQKFAEEMADVGRTTSDLVVTVPCYDYRHRAATAPGSSGATTHNLNMHEKYDIDFTITPTLDALQLHDVDERSQQRCFRLNARKSYWAKSAGMGNRNRSRVAATTNVAYQGHGERKTCQGHLIHSANTSPLNASGRKTTTNATRWFQSAAGRSTKQDINVKGMLNFTDLGLPCVRRSNSALIDKSSAIPLARTTTDFVVVRLRTVNQENTDSCSNRIFTDHGRKTSSKWRKDLKWEAPPALYGYRRSMTFHTVLFQSEKR